MPQYSIESEMRAGVEVLTLREGNSAAALLAPALGNNCFAFGAPDPVLEEISFAEFCAKPTGYGIPLLFPFPNRIRDGRFVFEGGEYNANPPRHGFVRDRAWRVIEHGASDEAGAWVQSRFDAADYADIILSQFPSLFTLDVVYRLRGGRLEMEITARNTGERRMPAGFGIHPYFHHPSPGVICVPARARWELVENLPTGLQLDVDGDYDLQTARSTEGLALDDIFTDLAADDDGLVRCRLNDTVIEFDRKEFPHVVVFTPPAPRRALCIEPNTVPTDAFNLQARGVECNVAVLAPGDEMRYRIAVYRNP
ncbi:MAG: aldose 1-epimerase [Blastocatellales bacterium]|nr:aldose 1-epimerase [Blastocatellales bacterium]